MKQANKKDGKKRVRSDRTKLRETGRKIADLEAQLILGQATVRGLEGENAALRERVRDLEATRDRLVDDLRLLGEQKCVLANSLQKAEGKASAANERVQELESQLGQVGDELKALQAEHDLARKYALTLARIWAMDSADLRSVEGDSLLHLLVGLGGKYSQFVSGLTLRIESLENNEKDSKPATSHRVGGFPCI